MRVSIIIPVYNAEKYLKRCIDSVLTNKESDIEVILINDGSTDESNKICEEYFSSDSRVVYINQKNSGVSAARNKGIENAKNEYVFFLDADDYLIDNYEKFFNGNEDFIAFSNFTDYASTQITETYPISKEESTNIEDARKILIGTHLFHTCWGKLFKREIICEHIVKFPENVTIGEDYIFVLEYFKYVNSARIVNKPILHYFINDSSVMRTYNAELRYGAWAYLVKYCLDYYNKENLCLQQDFSVYQLKNTTSYFYELCRFTKLKDSMLYIEKVLADKSLQHIITMVNSKELPFLKRMEYKIINSKCKYFVLVYFKLKSRIRKLGE